jgi:hypothetical protein
LLVDGSGHQSCEVLFWVLRWKHFKCSLIHCQGNV